MSENKRMENRSENTNYCSLGSSLSPSAAETGRFGGGKWECGPNRMVKIELEAAEALAGLAHSGGIQERETYGSESDWRSEVKLTSYEQAKSESPAEDLGVNPERSVPSDLAEDKALVVQQQCKKICNVMTSAVMAKHDAELPNHSSICTKSYVLSGGGTRQNMTEAEKEARRLRRVLANRESARQTIRRRQALHEELTRKAAILSCENDNLKREKEWAVKEYDSLKSTNQNLKAEMAKTLKDEVKETQKESESTDADITTATTPSNSQFFICNQPPPPQFLWPSVIQASNPYQSQPISSNIFMPSICKPDSSHEQQNPPLYIFPCSWFFPFPDHDNRLQPQPTFDLNVNQNNDGSSLEVTSDLGNPQSSLPLEVKIEPSSSIEALPAKNLHETSLFISSLPENNKDSVLCQSKKVVDSVAAAEARKRRKELKRLKNLHCRQF